MRTILTRAYYYLFMFTLCLSLTSCIIGPARVSSAASIGERIQEHSVASHRSPSHIKRNDYRNPAATLEFFQVQESQTVVEIWPGGKGWYTEILAPLLKTHGQLFVAHFDPNSPIKYFRDSHKKYLSKLAGHPELYSQVTVTAFSAPNIVSISNGVPADRVLTFRNVHNWMKAGTAEAAFLGFFSALKQGGILGVVEHRAPVDFSLEEMIKSGYVTEAQVKQYATDAGFKFIGASELNANPKDSKRHPKGVWTLPPSLRLGDKQRDKYIAIGESDRMTLKFIKP